MGLMHDDRQPQQPTTTGPLVDLNVEQAQPEETKMGLGSRRKLLSGAQAENNAAQPQPPAKAHRPLLAVSETKTSAPPVESEPQPKPQRPRLAEAAAAAEEQEQEPSLKPGRSRGAITHPCDRLPELQNIIDPPRLATDEPAPAPREQTPEPPPSPKPGRRCLGISPTDPATLPAEARPEPGPRRARLPLDVSAASEESPSTPGPGHSRGAITHACDNPPKLQSILDPPPSISNEPAPAPAEPTPEPPSGVDPVKARQFVEELRSRQSFTMALVGGLVAMASAAAVWALITTATNYQIGWMAVGVGFLVGGAVRMLGRGIDRSFAYLGATLSVLGCVLGKFLSACVIIADDKGLSLVAMLTQVYSKPDIIPGAMIATFHPLDLLFYGIAIYEGYRFSFRRVTEAEVSRALRSK